MSGKYRYVDWETLHDLVARLALAVGESYSPQVIVGVLRGGYIIARILSDVLGVEELGIVGVKFYRGIGETSERPLVTVPLVDDVRGRDALVVDDVADSGRTLETLAAELRLRGARTIKTAVVFLKPRSIVIPDFYAEVTDSWIVFPWELCDFAREMVRRGDAEALEHVVSSVRSSGGLSRALQHILGVRSGEGSTSV